ncbi:rubredoxin [Streptomyces sp. NPDC053079]|uniref:rubredoxin n=1 Tax=Streptomyces sp. NPDC053079 TaxID=3365697 RepID=UPI0037CCDF53
MRAGRLTVGAIDRRSAAFGAVHASHLPASHRAGPQHSYGGAPADHPTALATSAGPRRPAVPTHPYAGRRGRPAQRGPAALTPSADQAHHPRTRRPEGITPRTRWQDVAVNWTCPDCGARKEEFEMVEL